MAQMVKNPPAMWKTRVRSLGWEDTLEKEMATRSSILAWRIPGTEEPRELRSMGNTSIFRGCGGAGGGGTGNAIFTCLCVPFRASYHTSCPQSSPDRDVASPVPSTRAGGSEDATGGAPALGSPRTGP